MISAIMAQGIEFHNLNHFAKKNSSAYIKSLEAKVKVFSPEHISVTVQVIKRILIVVS